MDNPFDQFDAPKKNPFDQFDAKPATSYSFPEGEAGDSLAMQGPISHVLDAFGQGVKQQWGAMTASAGLSPATQQWMRKNGVWNDYSEGSGSFWKTMNEAIMRPAAVALDIYNQQVSPAALLSSTVRQTSDAMIAGGAPRDLTPGAFMEAFPAAHFTGFPANVPIPQSFAGIHSSAVAQALTRARNLGVIGEGDAGWRGIPASPEANAAAIEALTPNRDAIARQVSREPFGPQPAPQIEAPETQPAPDIHAVARQIAPATFAEFDALAMQKQTLRQWIADLGEQRGRGTSPEITTLDEQIDTLRGQRLEAPPGERAAMANRITAMEAERAKLAEGLPKEGDTPAMARLRRDLQTVDYRMRDLALGDVSDAYRRANEGEVPEAQPTEATASPAAEPAPPVQAKAPPEGGIAGWDVIEANNPPPEHIEPAPTNQPVRISSGNIPGELPILRFRKDAAAIEATLPPVAEGYTRLWRGNRPGEVGAARSFTNDLPGIALPFREPYGGHVSYVDVPTRDLAKYEHKVAAAPGAEFSLPPDVAATARPVAVTTEAPRAPLEGGIAGDMSRQLVAAGRPVEEAGKPLRP
jgi:hypothetical protein